MKSLGIKDNFNGYFSDILNYLKNKYPDVLYEKAKFEKALILKVPDEYNFHHVFNIVLNNFHYDYDIVILDELYENKLILITTL